MSEKKYVCYYRVSTKHQGNSGLGLEAQKRSVLDFIKHNGNKIISEFTEIESGKKNNRPELMKAIEYAKKNDATLCVARLDRLARDVGFISHLMEAKVKFVAADLPEMNTLTLYIFSALAQYEGELISKRTSAALQAKKQREPDFRFGAKNLTENGRKKAWNAIRRNARENQANRHAYHFIKPLREQGITYDAIAKMLNQEGYLTREGKLFDRAIVRRLWLRFIVQQ